MNTFQYISTNNLRWRESWVFLFFADIQGDRARTRAHIPCAAACIFLYIKIAIWLFPGVWSSFDKAADWQIVAPCTLAVLTMITGGCWCDLCLMGRSSKLQPGTMRGHTDSSALPKSMKSDQRKEGNKLDFENWIPEQLSNVNYSGLQRNNRRD